MTRFGDFTLADVQRVLYDALGAHSLALYGLADPAADVHVGLAHLARSRAATVLAGRIVEALMTDDAIDALHWPDAPKITITPADAETLEALPATSLSAECHGGPFDGWTVKLPRAQTLWVAEIDSCTLMRLTAPGDLPSIPLGAESLGFYGRHADRALWRPLPRGKAV